MEDADGRVRAVMAEELAAGGGGGIATQLKIVGYVTANIEDLKEGDWVLSRDQGDPDGPLVGGRISRKYRRIADHLELVGMEDAGGRGQTLRTTDEHPFFVPDKGWTKSRLLQAGDALAGPAEVCSIVTANARQSHPEGVVVYNMEVEGFHTYFVRGEGSDGAPVWVHNAGPEYTKAFNKTLAEDEIGGKYQRFVTGKSYEEIWMTPEGSLHGVDARVPRKFLIEVKWAGRDPIQFAQSRNNPVSRFFNETRFIEQARSYLDMNAAMGMRGVRYAVSNDAAREAYFAILRQHFPDAVNSGILQVWHVPANGMR